MKKIYLSLIGGIIFSGSFSQTTEFKNNHRPTIMDREVIREVKPLTNSNRATVITEQRVNAIDAIAGFYGSTPDVGFVNPIWPDTNATIVYSDNSTTTTWLHACAQVFDFDGLTIKGTLFDPATQPFDVATDLTIDSIAIQGYYNRIESDQNIVDTAVISIVSGNGNFADLYVSSNPDSSKNVINVSNRSINQYSNVIASYEVILDSAFSVDTTSNGLVFFTAAPNLVLNGHQGKVGVIIDYKPGRAYSESDTMFRNINNIAIIYARPFGASTDYQNGNGPDNTIGQFYDYNSKYGFYTSGAPLDRFLLPMDFLTDHAYQTYDVDMWVSQNNSFNVDVKELENGAKLFQNYPNPANGTTVIAYSLEEAATVSVEMMDVTGKIVYTSLEGTKANGTHSIEINTNDFTSGVYFYSVTVNGNKLTKKMTVAK